VRLAISNIAWDTSEDDAVADLLRLHCIDAIDVAPGKYFPALAGATDADMARVRRWWSDRGVEITGMQSLLFGTVGLNLFGPPDVQEAMLRHLAAVCRIGAGLGAPRLVFGSPKNRDRTGLADGRAVEVSVDFFRKVGDIAAASGVVVCLEPNPPSYGANFMTTSDETAKIVENVAHPAIRMQLDSGALTMNGERPEDLLRTYAQLIGHVHASEPHLVPLGDGGTDHQRVAAALMEYLPNHVVSIEMVATAGEPHVSSIRRAIEVADHNYRNEGTK
jgi:D-psicose/D-tagatose/L-ribulose 3-epimerase